MHRTGLKIFFPCILIATLTWTSIVVGQQLPEQRGNASYYHDSFHGRTMANGDIYHRDSMTCAHLKYPLGTFLRVYNPQNGKEVIVQVTDRGPYTRKFVIDLSRAAARELGIIPYGYRQVIITPFIPGKVPMKYQESKERPELDLGYSEDGLFSAPYWQEDSIYQANHRLTITEVPAPEIPDSLRSLQPMTTPQAKKAAKASVAKKEPAKNTKKSQQKPKRHSVVGNR